MASIQSAFQRNGEASAYSPFTDPTVKPRRLSLPAGRASIHIFTMARAAALCTSGESSMRPGGSGSWTVHASAMPPNTAAKPPVRFFVSNLMPATIPILVPNRLLTGQSSQLAGSRFMSSSRCGAYAACQRCHIRAATWLAQGQNPQLPERVFRSTIGSQRLSDLYVYRFAA